MKTYKISNSVEGTSVELLFRERSSLFLRCFILARDLPCNADSKHTLYLKVWIVGTREMTLWFVLTILAEPRAQFPAPMPSNSHLSVTPVLGNLTPSNGLGKQLHLCGLNGHKLKHMHMHLIKIILIFLNVQMAMWSLKACAPFLKHSFPYLIRKITKADPYSRRVVPNFNYSSSLWPGF